MMKTDRNSDESLFTPAISKEAMQKPIGKATHSKYMRKMNFQRSQLQIPLKDFSNSGVVIGPS